MSEAQKRFFINIREYALHKPKADEKQTKKGVCVRSNKKIILKLKIRRGVTVASFKLENDLLRDYRRNSEAAGAFRQKETEIYVTDDNAMEAACAMVDLMLQQYAREREETIRRRRARQAARRAEKRAERERVAQEKRAEAESPEISAKAAETETFVAEGEQEQP